MIENFIISVNRHRQLGIMLAPYTIIEASKISYSINDRITEANIDKYSDRLSEEQRQLVNIIEEYNEQNLFKRFSDRRITVKEFFNSLTVDYIDKHIRPFIERQIVKCLRILSGSEIKLYFKGDDVIYEENLLEINPRPAEMIFNFIKFDEGIKYFQTIKYNNAEINIYNKGGLIIANNPCWLLLEKKLYTFEDTVDGKKLLPFLNKESISIPKKMEQKYFETFIRNAIMNFSVNSEGFNINELNLKPKPILSLENDLMNEPCFILSFDYGIQTILANKKTKVFVKLNSKNNNYNYSKITRDFGWEEKCYLKLSEMGFERKNDVYFKLPNPNLKDCENQLFELVNWINHNKPLLKDNNFELVQSNSQRQYFTGEIQVSLTPIDSKDWFDISAVVTFGDTYQIPFILLRKHILNGKRYFELPNGEIAILPEEWFVKYKELMLFGEDENQNIRLKKHHYLILQTTIDKNEESNLKVLKDIYSEIKKTELPSGIEGKLRPYQYDGFLWLNHLRENNFGCCLADDMGLGKTLQTLVLLQKIKEGISGEISTEGIENNKPEQLSLFDQFLESKEANNICTSLIVMPASLIHNWDNEIKKFTPGLKTLKYTGNSRSKDITVFENFDIVLTTYGTVRNDVSTLRNFVFNYIILDESQIIKNPVSKITMAVNQLNAKNRMVLTGTPIENSLTDLWSQMNFLNKGILGNLYFFKKNFLVPIEKHYDKERQKKLQNLIHPFILRRTKSEVAKDLPPLIEKLYFCEMTEEQKQFYLSEKNKIRNQIFENIEKNGIKKSGFVILKGLTLLRQLANHPVMVDPSYEMSSGKFVEVIRNIESLIEENHKVLLFSSFVKHLRIFSDHFKSNYWDYSILTGQTHNREKTIKEFQDYNSNKLFLISLKAGGVGLNLTQADYVFLLDPWWNPASEDQAISRAHRIGQKKNVFVYKFITIGTIEEKIVQLQQKKSKLANMFINSQNPLKGLSLNNVEELFQ